MASSLPLSSRSSFDIDDKDFDDQHQALYPADREGVIRTDYLAWSRPVQSWAGCRLSSMRSFRFVSICLFVLMALIVGTFYHSHGGSIPSRAALSSVLSGQKYTKPEGVKIIALVFYGRPDRVEILDCFLKRNLVENGGFLDEVQWAVNTKKEDDIKWLDDILIPSSPSYTKLELLGRAGHFGSVWEKVERGHLYIKIDDDVVWLDDNAIPELVETRMKHPDAFAVSSNIINNPLLGWVHYRMGALHSYLPEVEAPTIHEAAEWRASLQPTWSGPEDFAFGLDEEPPFSGHRWLPVSNTSKINIRQTPVGKIEYSAFGTGWNSWPIAAQQHASFFENLEYNQLDLYKTTSKLWDFSGDRLSINFIAIWGDDIVNNSPIDDDDEPAITVDIPKKLGRSSIVASHSLVAHFTFGKQEQLNETNILARYHSYASDKVCKKTKRV